jgi:uncharacterized membrane protein
MLVAFPIGLLVGGYIFDLIGVSSGNAALWGAGWYCMIAGLVFGFCAAIPGLIDLLGVVPPNSSGRNRGWLHGGLNATVLIVFVWMAVYRGSAAAQPDALALTVQGCAVIALGFSGWLGGTLAYRNQIGIDRRYAGAGQLKTRALDSWDRPVCNQSELAHGQVMLAEIGGERVVVGKCPEGIAAFSDHCTGYRGVQRSLHAQGRATVRRRARRLHHPVPVARVTIRYPHRTRRGRTGRREDRDLRHRGARRRSVRDAEEDEAEESRLTSPELPNRPNRRNRFGDFAYHAARVSNDRHFHRTHPHWRMLELASRRGGSSGFDSVVQRGGTGASGYCCPCVRANHQPAARLAVREGLCRHRIAQAGQRRT